MLVIFDCDGVLVDSEPLANRVLAQHLTALGLETSTEQSMEAYMGFSMPSNMDRIRARLGKPLPDNFLHNLQQETFALFRSELKPVCGIEKTLASLLASEVDFCVASSGDFSKMALTLGLTGLDGFFGRRDGRNNIFSASEVARGKPHPDLFLHAAKSMQADQQPVVVIEDSLPGIEAALSAGMLALAYLPAHYPRAVHRRFTALLESSGVRGFSDMRELPTLLNGLTGSC